MLVAFASTDGIHINDHFGWCKCFYMYDLLEDSFVFVKAIDSTQELQEEGEKLAYKIGCIEEAKILCVSHIGPRASTLVKNAGIFVIKANSENDTIEDALLNLLKLKNTNPPLWMQRLLSENSPRRDS